MRILLGLGVLLIVTWLVLLLAVILLGYAAVRSLRKSTAPEA